MCLGEHDGYSLSEMQYWALHERKISGNSYQKNVQAKRSSISKKVFRNGANVGALMQQGDCEPNAKKTCCWQELREDFKGFRTSFAPEWTARVVPPVGRLYGTENVVGSVSPGPSPVSAPRRRWPRRP